MDNEIIRLVDLEKSTVRFKNKIKSYVFLFLLSVLYFGAYIFNYLSGMIYSDFAEIQ